jgi:hypothetical protein
MVLDWFVAILDCRSLEDTGTGSRPRAEPEDDAHSIFVWHRNPITRCQVRCWWTAAWEATARAERCCHVMRAVFQFQTTIWIQYFFLSFFLPLLLRGRRILLRLQTCHPLGRPVALLSTSSTRSRTKNSATNFPRNHELLLTRSLLFGSSSFRGIT